jgi:hypothetical protein
MRHTRQGYSKDEGMSIAGVFLIQRLEGSRFGTPTLWVLDGGVGGEGWGDKRIDWPQSCCRSFCVLDQIT